MANGLQTFMRMANIFGPQQPLVNRESTGIHIPEAYTYGQPTVEADDFAQPGFKQPMGGDQNAIMEAFRQAVLNPPQRTQMTYPKSTLAGLDAALKIAAEPSPLAKNRVYVDGNAYQKQRVWTDPATGKQHFITDVKEPSFMDQVMRAMPAAVSGSVDLLNQPQIDAENDWKLRVEGLQKGAQAESNLSLARQREAQAEYTAGRGDREQQRIDISRLTAEERVRLSQLNTLTDQEKLQMVQDGRISVAQLQAAEAMKRVEAQQAGADRRTSATISGQDRRSAASIEAQNQRTADVIAGQNQRNTANIEARQSSSGATGQIPTQQKVAMQNKARQYANQNPDVADYISFDANGFPVIEPPGIFSGPSKEEYDAMYEAIYGVGKAAPIETKQPTTTTTTTAMKQPTKPVTTAPTAPAPTGKPVEMITPDGQSTRMVPANQVELAKQQGYKVKGKG